MVSSPSLSIFLFTSLLFSLSLSFSLVSLLSHCPLEVPDGDRYVALELHCSPIFGQTWRQYQDDQLGQQSYWGQELKVRIL